MNNYYGTSDSTQPLPPSSRLCSTSDGSCTLTPNPVAANGNTAYYVIERACDGGGNCITRDGIPLYRITVDVVGPKNTRVTTQAMVNALGVFDPDAAIITEEKLEISGNPRFTGPVKKVHTNDVLKISGNGDPDPSVRVSEGTYTNSLEECQLSSCSAAPTVYIPAIIPSSFLSYADYRMMANGKVYNSGGTELFDTSGGSYWNGWKRDSTVPVRWTCCNGVTPPDGMYYVEGNVYIPTHPGSVATPWRLTLVAQGHIELSGNPYLADHKDAGDPAGIQDLFMVAGTDLKFNGNATHVSKVLWRRESRCQSAATQRSKATSSPRAAQPPTACS